MPAWKNKIYALEKVQQNGLALKDMPFEFQYDYDIALAAVKQNGKALLFLPESMYYQEIVQSAIFNYPEAIAYLDTISEELSIQALQIKKSVFSLLPVTVKNLRFKIKLIQEDWTIINYFDKEDLDQSIWFILYLLRDRVIGNYKTYQNNKTDIMFLLQSFIPLNYHDITSFAIVEDKDIASMALKRLNSYEQTQLRL